ncbi:hypothetical protein L6452_13281 [Arctium lappa]|uniref:Uncharacterized protein n=1 Tax=Arctium lappa TaxID=4217 RepID=A0ACB9CHR5_ARCLA|nr:hypothetical protein L6452_13281 [Arctium lappa]
MVGLVEKMLFEVYIDGMLHFWDGVDGRSIVGLVPHVMCVSARGHNRLALSPSHLGWWYNLGDCASDSATGTIAWHSRREIGGGLERWFRSDVVGCGSDRWWLVAAVVQNGDGRWWFKLAVSVVVQNDGGRWSAVGGGGSGRRWSAVVQIGGDRWSAVVQNDGGRWSKIFGGLERWWFRPAVVGDGSEQQWFKSAVVQNVDGRWSAVVSDGWWWFRSAVVQIGDDRQWFRSVVGGGSEWRWSMVDDCRWFRPTVVGGGSDRWWSTVVQTNGGQ